jgi:hypothetical protein
VVELALSIYEPLDSILAHTHPQIKQATNEQKEVYKTITSQGIVIKSDIDQEQRRESF